MLPRLFLISIILLVGITIVVKGTQVAETIEVIKAVKFPRMGSGNLTLDRRFIVGIPGLPQCPNPNLPQLVSSRCFSIKTLYSICMDPRYPRASSIFSQQCLENTVCMDFITDPGPSTPPEQAAFGLCVDEEFAKRFDNGDKEGVYCKTYVLDGVTGNRATLSIDVYDGSQNPAKVRSVSISSGSSSGSKENTSNYSRIINCKNKQKVKVCMNVLSAGITLYARFTFLDGTYGNSK
ncbi:hypothetical protein Glove_57g90 [Diversispora epigaea]|uniref:Uncharacterized protein n=1 Tax=Diversispora epigaea TaxID=1348612 RepID=A0A397JFP1_9GLOM|nr:hypothetical protein Glove_57g90 [Diversispora epigaea]